MHNATIWRGSPEIIKERPISTLISPSTLPADSALREPRRTLRVPNWVNCIPFIALHLLCLGVLFTGVDTTSIILLFALYFLRMFGITAGYHRYFAHKSYKTSRVGQFALAWLGCSSLQRGPLWWAAHHRGHHRYSDTPNDPHSPHETTFWWAHLGWILSSDNIEVHWQSIRDFAAFWELRWLERLHWAPGIITGILCYVIGAVCGGWDGSLSTFFIQPAGWSSVFCGFLLSTVLVYHATFSINSLSHLWGKRRYATADDSRNNWFLALITLGEGWHNNHHHYQSAANQGFFWYEIDISFAVIRTLQFFGLVWDVRKPGQKALYFRNIEQTKPAVKQAAG